MAKKKNIGITPEMLADLNKQTEEDNKKLRQKKEERDYTFITENDGEQLQYPYTGYAQDRVGMVDDYAQTMMRRQIAQIKKFDRKRERPIQKTVHLTIEVDNKVNMIKSVLKTLGKKTTFEDFLFDLLDNWLKEHYDEVLGGKVVYPGEDN